MTGVPHLRVEHADGVATLSFDRPGKLNAANRDTFRELVARLAEIDRDDTVDIAILTGTGRAFCAGVDIDALQIDGLGSAVEWIAECQASFAAVENCRKPVIAAVNGLALGYGVEIAMVCDISLAAEQATFSLPEARLGMLPAVLVTRGRDRVGRQAISYLAMTGDPIPAAEAQTIGLLNKVFPAETLMNEARSMAQRIRRNGPLGVRTVKRLLNRDGQAHTTDVIHFLSPLLLSDDVQEARSAFSARRRPVFRGR